MAALTVTAATVQRSPARPHPIECRVCGQCGHPIEPDTEHYPHRPGCTLAGAGWCDCDHPTHPQCCPTCPTAMRP